MTKTICTLLVLFSTVIINGQNITLLKNFNPKAKELKHNLNATKDSLLLECENTIFKIEIFNEDYENIIIIEGNEAQISLKSLPIGKFVVEAKLADKIIVIDLIKHDHITDTDHSTLSHNNIEIAEGKGMMLDETLNLIKSSPNHSIEYILTRGKTKKSTNKKQKFYWTVTKFNNKSGSSKTMKLVSQESVNRMILKNKLEHNKGSDKLNELTVWEVYNTRKFMAHQVSNPNFIYSLTSDFFNTSPYYSTKNSIQNI